MESAPSTLDTLDPAFSSRFGGIGRLYGLEGLERLRHSHVCVIGVGGVGSWTVEALARSAVGEITMIDLDDVCVTNTNRQLHALEGQIGRSKVDVLAERVVAIQPSCKVHALTEFLTAGSVDRLLDRGYDVVVDAIDKLSNKCVLLDACWRKGIPIVTVGGAGGKRDGTAVRVNDLAQSEQDELLRQVRRKLRRDYGFPRDPQATFGIPCIYSPEKPYYPWSNGTACSVPEEGSDLTLDCASGFGTATFVTGAFGFAVAGEVVRKIATGR